MKKRLLSMLLVLSVLLSAVPVYAGASDQDTMSGGRSNPLYEGQDISGAQNDLSAETMEASSNTVDAYYVTPSAAAAQLRDAMVARQTSVTLYIYYTGGWYDGENYWIDSVVFDSAVSETLASGITDGDYLMWSWIHYYWNADRSGSKYIYTIDLIYYTTTDQEQQFLTKLDQVCTGLNLSGQSDYDKYTAIYDYVTTHVTYDRAGLSAGNDPLIFTAYKAMCIGTAVCQGYAAMFYAMCRYEGLPVRILTSTDHAWNMVKLKDIWYQVDATWDSGTYTHREWYLLGSGNFDGGSHTRSSQYLTSDFIAAYPISAIDYDANTSFRDVPTDSYYYGYLLDMVERGLIKGTGEYTFEPDTAMTRGMLVTVLWRLEGSPTAASGTAFSDVAAGMYYTQPVAWASGRGIVNGYGDGSFRPDAAITREQMVKILYLYARDCGYNTTAANTLSAFPDASSVSSYALPAMRWAVGAGIVNGMDGMLNPQGIGTRAQVTTMLARFIAYYNL